MKSVKLSITCRRHPSFMLRIDQADTERRRAQ